MYKHAIHPQSMYYFWYCTELFDDLSNNRYSLWFYAGKLVFVYNILRGKMNCLIEFNFVKILENGLFILCITFQITNLNLHRIDFAFSIIFHIQFHCLRTYFIHQDSTRCETCNILNPIFLYL